ncbi:Putative ribosomal N-acetyltransferase YdaF [BD1-7 clade bacterium]|uniref:Ribosomal N-acetyltransferase YdaF n=1 Tax=BD1-7 clade bacterium TaxID=2029982 RepID=A0A5S9PHT3_9GAMM|nr:Putative ribosomal N-acetyltransferase YdaF [BD1-7 clade bacterium]CAA0103311.1 Putative ribosomal N-acetyltransferase YdaF [BD1-7 clade bacterium]
MLKGNNIHIRAIREADLDELARHLNDIEGRGEFLPTIMVSNAELHRQYNEDGFISEASSRFLITDHSGHILGSVWAFKSVPYFDAMEVGYHIFEPQNCGKGFASEALRLFTDFLFESQQINRVEVRVSTENTASENVAKKIGFVYEGTNREAAFSKGKLFDMHMYSIIRRDWQQV